MKKARVINGAVVKVIEPVRLALFPPHIQAEFIDAPDGTETGDLYDGTTFSKPLSVPTVAEFVADAQKMMDEAARQRGYDDIKSAVTYVGDPNPQFDAEGTEYRRWRSTVWTYCYAELDKVKAGTRTPPATLVDFRAELMLNCPLNLPPQA